MNGKDNTVSVVVVRIIGTLVTVGIIGGVGLAVNQGKTDDKVVALEEEQKRVKPIVDSVDVMKSDIQRIKVDIRKIETKIEDNQKELLQAIRED